jgi:hypothetical protein
MATAPNELCQSETHDRHQLRIPHVGHRAAVGCAVARENSGARYGPT